MATARRSGATNAPCATRPFPSACTALYRLHKEPQIFFWVNAVVSGLPAPGGFAAFEFEVRTVAAWQRRAGEQAKRVHEHLVLGQQRDLGQVQADEIRVKMQKGIQWMAWRLRCRRACGWEGC